MTAPVRIDLVSDVACPWCAIGLTTLEQAVAAVQGSIAVSIHLQPFELNPDMPKGGQEVMGYLSRKYGIAPEQVRINQQRIYDRATEVGFEFHPEGRKHVYNTFNCHRLLYWAEREYGAQEALALKKALLAAYFTEAADMDDPETLLAAVDSVDLERARAADVLEQNEFDHEVRAAQTRYKMLGIQGVPAFIINEQFLVEGAQPVENLVAAIRQAAQRAAQAPSND
jgi:predicted DsbA family dithiol-disulfide isomerase